MLAVDIALLGQAAHVVLIGLVIVGVLVAGWRRIVDHEVSSVQRKQQMAAIASVIALLGGAFRFTPFGLEGRLILAGSSLVVAVALAGFALDRVEIKRVLSTPGPLRWMLAYGLAATPSILIATDPLAAAGGAAGVLSMVAVAAAVGTRLTRPAIGRMLELLAVAAVVLATSSAVLTPGESFASTRSLVLTQRFLGWFPFVELGWGHLGVGLIVIGLERQRWRWPALASGFMLIAMTQARGAAIAAVAVGLVWVLLAHRRRMPLVIGALSLLVLAAVFVQPVRDVWDREQAVVTSPNIFSFRAEFVKAGLGVAEASPVIGRGIDSGTVDDFSDELTFGKPGLITSTHMAWMSALVGAGALGLGFFVAALASAWRWAISVMKASGQRWPSLVMAWATASSFFLAGPAELSAQGVVFALAILAVSVSAEPSDDIEAAHAPSMSLS